MCVRERECVQEKEESFVGVKERERVIKCIREMLGMC